MATWNYRICEHNDALEKWYGLHEVHYDESGAEMSWTENPTTFVGESADDIKKSLTMALHDTHNKPVFVIPEKEPHK